MKIIIECDPDIDKPEEQMFQYLKTKLKEPLRKFKLSIEGTELKYSHPED